jgi:hypothetical protein
MSNWKLVEAVPEEHEADQEDKRHRPRSDSYTNSRGERNNNRPRRTGNNNGNGRTKSERSYFAYMAIQQM